MSVGEQLYLAMVVGVFAAFGVLMIALCWLDTVEDRQDRRRAPAQATSQHSAPSDAMSALH